MLRGTGSAGIAGATVVVLGEQTQAQVVSDRDGTWAIDDLIPGNYGVRARMPTGNVERIVQLRAGTAGTIVDLRVDTGRTVRGVVRGSDGQPLPGALVAPRGGGGRTTVTDGSGEFVLDGCSVPIPSRWRCSTAACSASCRWGLARSSST